MENFKDCVWELYQQNVPIREAEMRCAVLFPVDAPSTGDPQGGFTGQRTSTSLTGTSAGPPSTGEDGTPPTLAPPEVTPTAPESVIGDWIWYV